MLISFNIIIVNNYIVVVSILTFPINWKHNFKIIRDAVEDYARGWIKREVDQDAELESLSDWVRTIRSLVQGRIHKLKNCVNSLYLKTKKLLSVFPLFMTNMLSFLRTRLPTTS